MDIKTVVGLDLETTALDPIAGEIIEVAVIRYDWQTGQEVARLVALCRAAGPLTETIQQLTGITDAMLADKPFFKEIIPQLKEFIGADIVFAHNAPFDVGWLNQHGLKIDNPVWDTFPLAGVTWPEAPSYNLGMLARQLELPKSEEHRAAGDVGMGWALLQKIRAELKLSPAQGPVVQGILERVGHAHYLPLFSFTREPFVPTSLRPTKKERPLRTVGDILGKDGVLAKKLASWQFRAGQLKMAEVAYKLLSDKKTGLIEAGTGLGKTYAYLVAGLLWLEEGVGATLSAGRQVVISTRTRYLQDQLLLTDLPLLLKATGQKRQIAALKGRNNYVCSQRLASVIQEGGFIPAEAWQLLKIVRWLDAGGSGDLERLNFSHNVSFGLLARLNADALRCQKTCSRRTCVYHRARQQAEQADFVVINHALLVQLGGEERSSITKSIVVDEAHHLAEAARSASRRDFSEAALKEVLAGVVRTVASAAGKELRSQLTRGAKEVVVAWQNIVSELTKLPLPTRSNRLVLTATERRGSAWQRIERLASDFVARMQLVVGLGRGVQLKLSPKERLVWQEVEQQAETFLHDWGRFVTGSADRLQWLDFKKDYFSKQPVVELCDVARDIRALLAPLFSGKHGVVLTSATLTTGGTFGYIKEILGINEAAEFMAPSPFKYRDNMLIYIVEHGPNPADQRFDTYSAGVIERLAGLLAGHTLVLLTSHKALGTLYQLLISSLHKANIKLLAQGMTGGRRNIVERFKQNHNTVLLGTASFWEGLDLPGENVSALVIPRLPFPPPDDPVNLAAGSGYDTFLNTSLPQMLLRLRQGVGRLLRAEKDRGVVVLLDARFLQANYRAAVLTTLPAATIKIGTAEDMPRVIQEFLGEEQLATWRAQHKNQQKSGG